MSFRNELNALMQKWFGHSADDHPDQPAHPVTPGRPAPPSEYDTSGWAFKTASLVGGLRSRGVDATVAELVAKGYSKLAAQIPVYFLPRFWAPASKVDSFAAPDPGRFSHPSDSKGLSASQVDQLVANLQAVTNNQMRTQIVSTGANALDYWRGEFGQQGFAPVVPGTSNLNFSPAPIYNQAAAAPEFPRMPGNVVYEYADAPGYSHATTRDALMDHFGMDVLWDGQTDANITRFVRSNAIAQGAKIALELP